MLGESFQKNEKYSTLFIYRYLYRFNINYFMVVDSSQVESAMERLVGNRSWEEMIDREPLLSFSFYLSGRINVLLEIADEIIDHLDSSFSGAVVNGSEYDRASSLMWLWSLAAYEVVRTICAAPGCFSQAANDRFKSLKDRLAKVRMPAAKMEKRGRRRPVSSNRSPDGLDPQNKDLLIGDPEVSPMISARALLKQFNEVFASIFRDDVLKGHETEYEDAS